MDLSFSMERDMPMNLTEDILFRLPAKSLGRFMCTSKSWYSLIKSSSFIKNHLKHSKVKDRNVLIFQEGFYTLFSESDTALIEKERGRIPLPLMERDLCILGSYQGLVLVRLKVQNAWLVLLWNPLLNKLKLIDSIPDNPRGKAYVFFCTYALGFNETTNDYKVVRIIKSSKWYFAKRTVDVYSLTEDNWHRVNGTLPNGSVLPEIYSPTKTGAYVNGVVHWLAEYTYRGGGRFVILSFDFDIDVFKLIELPKDYTSYELKSYSLELKELFGKLAICGLSFAPCCYCDPWVLEEYPLVDSWSQIILAFEHKGSYNILQEAYTRKGNCIFREITGDNTHGRLKLYNCEDEIYDIEVVTPFMSPVVVDFVDCLVLLDVEDQVLED